MVEIELSVKFSPPFANTFSVMCNFIKTVDKSELERKYIGDFSELRKIINSWNLIPGSPKDEFDNLSNKILSQLYKKVDEEKIFKILESELIVRYGFFKTEIDTQNFTGLIIEWWNNK